MATWIKGQVVKADNHKIEIDDRTGVVHVLWDKGSSDQIKTVLEEDVDRELETYGIAED